MRGFVQQRQELSWRAAKTICIVADSAQGAMINGCNKIQTTAKERDQTSREDLQLGELEVLEELP